MNNFNILSFSEKENKRNFRFTTGFYKDYSQSLFLLKILNFPLISFDSDLFFKHFGYKCNYCYYRNNNYHSHPHPGFKYISNNLTT